jgi:hypothetical protein
VISRLVHGSVLLLFSFVFLPFFADPSLDSSSFPRPGRNKSKIGRFDFDFDFVVYFCIVQENERRHMNNLLSTVLKRCITQRSQLNEYCPGPGWIFIASLCKAHSAPPISRWLFSFKNIPLLLSAAAATT